MLVWARVRRPLMCTGRERCFEQAKHPPPAMADQHNETRLPAPACSQDKYTLLEEDDIDFVRGFTLEAKLEVDRVSVSLTIPSCIAVPSSVKE